MKSTARDRWTHKSVRALRIEAGGIDPIHIIREKAKQRVLWAKRLGWSGPPFNPLQLASLMGIKTKESSTLFSAEAQLTPLPGRQLLLEFAPERSEGRKNFSVCHEIAHTFFPDCFEMVHHRRSVRLVDDADEQVEHLCQVAAAELLMPEDEFSTDLQGRGISLESVVALTSRYRASREAVIRRIVSLGGRPAAAVFLARGLTLAEKKAVKGGSETPTPKLRVLYAVMTDGFPVFFPRNKSVPDDSCAYVAESGTEVVAQRESWELAGFGHWQVEAMSMNSGPSSDGPSVVALVTPD